MENQVYSLYILAPSKHPQWMAAVIKWQDNEHIYEHKLELGTICKITGAACAVDQFDLQSEARTHQFVPLSTVNSSSSRVEEEEGEEW